MNIYEAAIKAMESEVPSPAFKFRDPESSDYGNYDRDTRRKRIEMMAKLTDTQYEKRINPDDIVAWMEEPGDIDWRMFGQYE